MASPDVVPHRRAHRRSRRRRGLYRVLAAVTALVIAAGITLGPLMSRVEEPQYRIERADGSIEIRSYGPMVVAEASLRGERTAALGAGFRLIAGYIFGANDPNPKMDRTAPVQQQQGKRTIAMTAPVSQQADGETWIVRFIMPAGSTMESLPTPADPRVQLTPVPGRRMAVIRFRGFATADAILTETDRLRSYASSHRLRTIGEPLLAFYNPPWTLPFFRRNEIMLELAEPQIDGVKAP